MLYRATKGTIEHNGRTIFGYVSTFEAPEDHDAHGEIVAPGAFLKTIQDRGARVKVLWQHDFSSPIGKAVELHEDTKGLYGEGKLSDVPKAGEALELVQDGVLDSFSIGFDYVRTVTLEDTVVASGWFKGDPVRQLLEVKLYEFSPVTFPSNEHATIDGLKHWRDVGGILVPITRLKTLSTAVGVSFDRLIGHLVEGDELELERANPVASILASFEGWVEAQKRAQT